MVLANLQFINSNNIKVEIASQPEAAHGTGGLEKSDPNSYCLPLSGATARCQFSSVQSLSCFQLFATPWTIACQAPLSMEFSMQEYWTGLPFPSLIPADTQAKPHSTASPSGSTSRGSPRPAAINLIATKVQSQQAGRNHASSWGHCYRPTLLISVFLSPPG